MLGQRLRRGAVGGAIEPAADISDGAPELHAEGFAAHHNFRGVVAAGGAALTLRDALLHDNLEHGLNAEDQAALELAGGELYANGQAGLWFGGRSLKLRGATVRDNAEFGLYVEGEPACIDLGTFSEASGNHLYGDGPGGNGDQLLDARPDLAGLGPIVFTVSATELSDTFPAPAVYVGPYLDASQFSILGQNQLIQIY